MRHPSQLRIISSQREVPGTPLDADGLRRFEERFGISIPDDLNLLLGFANGGSPDLSYYQSAVHGRWVVNDFYTLAEDENGALSVWQEMSRWRRVMGANAIPFASDGIGSVFYLDIRRDSHPVFVCAHDYGDSDDDETLGFVSLELAPDLASFIDNLQADSEPDVQEPSIRR